MTEPKIRNKAHRLAKVKHLDGSFPITSITAITHGVYTPAEST